MVRHSDLAVFQSGLAVTAPGEPLFEAALFEGRLPVLMIPAGVTPPFRRIVVAASDDGGALPAVRAAMPLLKLADAVNIVTVAPPRHPADTPDPGDLLAVMLARHGVATELSVLPQTLPRIADTIARHVRETGADLVVMGAYGHSRLRERMLGGVTRDMLSLADMPLFLAH
jgi:nucleotide-binding universal stress UspA family protein